MFKSGYIAIIGKPNVGKSLILNKLLGEKVAIVSKKPETTRDKIQGILTKKEYQAVFIDTPGIHKPKLLLGQQMVRRAKETLFDADIILFVLDIKTGIDAEDKLILELVKDIKKPVILAINKVDLARKERLLPVMEEAAKLHDFKEIIPTSAFSGDNMDVLLNKIVEILPEGPMFYPQDQLTDKSERFIAGEMIREKVLEFTHEEVPHSVAVLVEEMKFREGKDLFYIRAVVFVERDTQRAILIGRGGSMLKKIGEESRKEIENFLGKRVYLDLWIKVHKDWRKDEHALKMLGYI